MPYSCVCSRISHVHQSRLQSTNSRGVHEGAAGELLHRQWPGAAVLVQEIANDAEDEEDHAGDEKETEQRAG
ncbi:MAG: hypothetical protein ABIR67_14515 [Gaiellaceae bacterium]